MEITSIESLRQRRQQLRSDHEQTKAELDRRHAYFAANKFTILWDTFSPFGAGEKAARG